MKKPRTPNPSQPAAAAGPQPSTLNPPLPFSPAPDESPEAFEAFRAFFEMKGRRHMSTLAEKVGVSVRTVRRWAKAFDWSGRLNQHRARLLSQSAQLQAEQQRQEILDWAERGVEIRECEWEIAHDLLQAIHRRLRSDVLDEANLADLARSFSIASRIARLAAGLPNTPPDEAVPDNSAERDFHTRLERIVNAHKAKMEAEAAAANQPPPPPPHL